MRYYLSDFNAYSDGVRIDTISIQKAIDECSKNGGGEVVFEKGKVYRSGKLIIKSNVCLYFEDGAKLIASNDINDFSDGVVNDSKIDVPTWENCDYSGAPTLFFLYAKDQKNISIKGNGVIDGNEEIFYGKVSKYHIDGYFYPRVPLIFFENITNLNITDVTLTRSGFWTTHLVGCNNVLIDSVKIKNNLRLANCDGIDPDHCKNVIIRNCDIEAADDCIVFKTTAGAKKYGACENIEVYNCHLVSTSAAIKFGTESVSDFRNIYVHDCVIERSNRGISFQLRDEGNITNIKFENISIDTRRFSPIEWWGKAEPIVITSVPRYESTNNGVISDVSFKNIRCNTENGVFIYGDNYSVKNINFDGLFIELNRKTKWELNTHDLRPCYKWQIIKNPMNYVYMNSCENISFKDYSFNCDSKMKEHMGDEVCYIGVKGLSL